MTFGENRNSIVLCNNFFRDEKMRYLLNGLYIVVAVLLLPMVLYRMVKQGRYKEGWGDKLTGNIYRRRPDEDCIWIHAVSVGEINATRTIVEELKSRFSDHEIVISTTTDTGQARARKLYGEEHRIFYFPIDFTWAMNKAFRNLSPSVCLLMELEVWPNFINTAHKFDCPVAVVNGRISDHSYKWYKRVWIFAKRIFEKIDLILSQTEEYKERFIDIGCRAKSVQVTGTLKYDTAEVTDSIEGTDELAQQLGLKGQRIWVAGGTGNDEEKLIVDAFGKLKERQGFDDLRLVVVPRKPERFDEAAEVIKAAGFNVERFSEYKDTDREIEGGSEAVILGDTMGDLRKFYSLATVIFVGRSLVSMGGSDMMEAAALGRCTMFGPYAYNFRQTVNSLLEGKGAIMVEDEEELVEKLEEVLNDEAKLNLIAQNGQEVIRQNQGATERTVEAIEKIIKKTGV